MTFAQTHDTLWYSPKFGKLTFAARGLWVTCQSWCVGQLTDGLIPERDVKDIGGSAAQIRALVNSGLWEVVETEGGERAYQFHDWLDHNESAAKISTKKRKERERKAVQRAKRSDPDLTQTSGKSDPNLTQTSTKSDSDLTQTSGKSGGGLSTDTPSYLPEPKSVPGGKEREEKRSETKTPKCVTARPSDEAHTPSTEQEAKDEKGRGDRRKLPTPRLSGFRRGSAAVDVSVNGQDASLSFDETSMASEPQATPEGTPAERLEGPDQARWDKYERRIGKPLEHMTPKELVVYMETFHRETNDISKHSGPAGVTTMKKFQEDYGSTHTAELFRYLFEDDGVWEISSGNKEPVTHIHFSENLRWWIEKVDGERQLKTKSKRDFDSKYTFATSLTPDDDLVFATEL